ncbi:MAG: STAS domain-containing protein [Clostridia bacterium]|nr:STAS domain-containing protein [Clostridia bacterium]
MTKDVRSDFENGVLTLKMPDEIDHHSAKLIRAEADSRLLTLRPKKLVMDLSGTRFMDSSGLGLILGRARNCEKLKVDYQLRDPAPQVKTILMLAGVDGIIKIAGTSEEFKEKEEKEIIEKKEGEKR